MGPMSRVQRANDFTCIHTYRGWIYRVFGFCDWSCPHPTRRAFDQFRL